MKRSPKAIDLLSQISDQNTRLGDLRKLAATVKKDHELALELWSTGRFLARQLAILIMDKRRLTQDVIDGLDRDMGQHSSDERLHLMDWLMANQLAKDRLTTQLMLSWAGSASVLQRRAFWYHQGRLRWVGQVPPPNTPELLAAIESEIEKEVPEVQWAMNFTAAQIGIFQQEHRQRCIDIGLRTGLFRDEVVAKNCTPNYLPDFIAIQVAKLAK